MAERKSDPNAARHARRIKDEGGRPSTIGRVVAQREDGTDITVADQIVASLRAGSYMEPAIAATGESKSTVYGWLKVAGQARIKAQTGTKLTAHEDTCIAFSDAVAEAESTWEIAALGTLERLGRGGIEQTTTTVKHERREKQVEKDGKPQTVVEFVEVERTTVTRKSLPNAQVLQWRLTRRFPERYGDHVDITTHDGELTVDERAEALFQALEIIEDVNSAKESK